MSALETAASSLGLFSLYAAGTGLAAAVFNQGIQSFRDRAKRKRAAEDFALKCAALLERFTHESLDSAASIDSELSMGADPSKVACKLASLEEYPEVLDGWKGLKKVEAGYLVNVRLKLENDARALSTDAWREGPAGALDLYRDANIMAAADAWHLAKLLRDQYGLPEHGKIDARDPEDFTTYFLEHELNSIHAREQAAYKARAKIVEKLDLGSPDKSGTD